jgi:chemotaxis protein methyltransferase CheR
MTRSESLSEEQRKAFVRLIAKRTGIEIRERDQANLSTKILLRMKVIRLSSATFYYQLLESLTENSHHEWLALIALLTNSESYFFRDREQFSLLRNHILPELVQRKQESQTIRICSAGCSSGEEPYSIAILLKEIIPELEHWNLTILGVDINQVALKKAEAGIYSPWSFRSVSSEVKQQYFQFINNQYHIDSKIKEMVRFKTLNLIGDQFPQQDSELKEMDLIVCRNVLIYFETLAVSKVLSKFHQTLQPLGYLLTGHAELHNQDLSKFQIKVFTESLIYQRIDNNLKDISPAFAQNNYNGFSTTNSLSALDDVPEKLSAQDSRMQEVALTLLKQLSPNTRIPKLGNLTAAELILQLEAELKALTQELP